MESPVETECTPLCQGNVVLGYEQFLKSMSFFELSERRIALVSIVELPVSQIADSFFFAQLDGFGNQGIGGSLVKVG